MDTHIGDLDTISMFPVKGHKKDINRFRITIILACSITIWLSGSLALIFTGTLVNAKQHTQLFRSSDQALPTTQARYKTPAASQTLPGPTAAPKALPVAKPNPIMPFPPYLQQEVDLLQVKDRMFWHGNPNLPEVALTFDDGPNPPYTGQILDVLKQYHVQATFFDVGRQVFANPDLVKREYAEGHIVGNHTWAHPYLPYLSDASIKWQLTTTSDIIKHTIGVRPIFFRPPWGAYNTTILTNVNALGMTTFIWNADQQDWSMPGVNAIINKALYQIRNGSIVLMHDGGGDRSQTVAALSVIIETLQGRGLHLVTLQQMVDDAHKTSDTVSHTGADSTTQKPTSELSAWRRRLRTLPHAEPTTVDTDE